MGEGMAAGLGNLAAFFLKKVAFDYVLFVPNMR